MKKSMLAPIALLILLVAPFPFIARTASAQVGIAAGLNFERLGDIKANSRSATFDNSTGYHVGIYFDLGAGPVSLRPGLFYRDMGNVVLTQGAQESSFDLSMVEVPIDIRFRFFPVPLVKPYLLGGPVVAFATSSDDAFNDAVRKLLLSANAGAGVEISLGSVTLAPELRFGFSVNRWLEEGRVIAVGGTEISSDDVSRQSAVMLRLGVGF